MEKYFLSNKIFSRQIIGAVESLGTQSFRQVSHACTVTSVVSSSLGPHVAHQAPLSMGISRQEQRSELPCPPPGDLPNPGIKPWLLHLLRWQVSSLPLAPPGLPRSQSSSVTQSCPPLCDPVDCSTPGLPVHHQIPEFTQTHVQ